MTLEPAPATKPVRRTQAQRTDAARRALIAAAIKLLNSHGYAGATLNLIAEEAGVTRGCILHQFGTRASLMTEVVKAVYDENRALYAELIGGSPSGGRKFSDWPQVVWPILSRPGPMAVLEILQGARSDRELAEYLRPVQAEIERSALITAIILDQDDPRHRALFRLIVATIRGLSFQSLTASAADMDDAVRMLTDLLALYERQDGAPV